MYNLFKGHFSESCINATDDLWFYQETKVSGNKILCGWSKNWLLITKWTNVPNKGYVYIIYYFFENF